MTGLSSVVQHALQQPTGCMVCPQQWVRTRAKQGGFPRLSAVHLVSSIKGTGVSALLQTLRAAAGAKGDVWVVGAQVSGTWSVWSGTLHCWDDALPHASSSLAARHRTHEVT